MAMAAGFGLGVYKPLLARKVPAASGAEKKSGSSSSVRPIVFVGRPEDE
jgi:hypothetical protein